jgi:hypothetical protein
MYTIWHCSLNQQQQQTSWLVPRSGSFHLFAFFLPEDGKWCHDARNLDCFSVVVVVLQNQ